MYAQDLDQFSVDTLQEFNLRANHAQLPKQNAIANNHHQNKEGKTERQMAANLESMKTRSSGRLPQPSNQSRSVQGTGHRLSTWSPGGATQRAPTRKGLLRSSSLERDSGSAVPV